VTTTVPSCRTEIGERLHANRLLHECVPGQRECTFVHQIGVSAPQKARVDENDLRSTLGHQSVLFESGDNVVVIAAQSVWSASEFVSVERTRMWKMRPGARPPKTQSAAFAR